jgi:hypothetical protein
MAAAKRQRVSDVGRWGYVAFDVPGIEGIDYTALTRAMQAWFTDQLRTPLTFKATSPLHGVPLDFADPGHVYALFCRYKAHLTAESAAVCRAAWNGNVNAQGKPSAGLTQSGFGWSAHIRALECMLTTLPPLLKTASGVFGKQMYLGGLGHLIWKQPHDSAGKLAWHTDSGSAEDAVAVALASPTMTAMGNTFGWQALLHLRGEAGHTLFLKYMTPARQAAIFLALLPGHEYPGIKYKLKSDKLADEPDRVQTEFPVGFTRVLPGSKTWTARGGPVFVNHGGNIKVYNRVIGLIETGQPLDPTWVSAVGKANVSFLRAKFATEAPHPPPLLIAPMVPDDHLVGTPYTVFWPKSSIHAAAATGPTDSRLTVTLKITFEPKSIPDADATRLRRLGEWVGADPGRRTEIEGLLNKDTPFCGGIVHRDMSRESYMLRYFGHLYANSADVEKALALA